MKNKRHSKLIHELCRLKHQYHYYLNNSITLRQLLSCSYSGLCEKYYINWLRGNLESDRYIITCIQERIKQIKYKICKIQKEYSINHANQQPSRPLIKLEGLETNS